MQDAHALECVRDQYRHGKPMLILGSAAALLEKAGIPATLPDGGTDPALIGIKSEPLAPALVAFKAALAGSCKFERETGPPRV